MSEFPKYGTAPIKCSKRKCGWTGVETELAGKPDPTMSGCMQNVCPKCGNDSYYFVTQRKPSAEKGDSV